MSGNGELMVPTSLRGFHFYSPIWTNIASGQELYFRKQPKTLMMEIRLEVLKGVWMNLIGFLIFHRFYDKFLIDSFLYKKMSELLLEKLK